MRKSITLIVMIALLVTTQRCSLFESKSQNQFQGLQAIQDIENSKFGRQLLDTIALQMQNEAPLQDIAQLLGDIRADLISQQRDDDDLQAQREEDCELTIADFQFRIATHIDNMQTATQTISQLGTEITQLMASIAGYETQIEILTNRLEVVHADRALDEASFAMRMQKSGDTVEALDLIIPKLGSLTPHAAAQALVELSKIGRANPIAAFMEVASTLNPELLANVIEKMRELKDSLVASMAEDEVNEAAAKAAYEQLVRDIEATLTAVTGLLTEANSNLAQARSKLDQTKQFLEEQTQALAAAKDGLAAKEEECRVWKVNYDNTKEARAAEQHVVEQVQAILAERLQSMSQYLKDRVDN